MVVCTVLRFGKDISGYDWILNVKEWGRGQEGIFSFCDHALFLPSPEFFFIPGLVKCSNCRSSSSHLPLPTTATNDTCLSLSKANLDTNVEILLPTQNMKPCLLYPKTPAYEPHGRPHTKTACVAGSSEETGVSFDCPMQANPLQNANKVIFKWKMLTL